VTRRGRWVLDDAKMAQIVAILSMGCSQNMAAQYVGCSPSTIYNTAARDPKFAKKLREAKGNAEIGLIKQIRAAAKKDQYWRAAAWALERTFPERYARRGPDVITVEQIGLLLTKFAGFVVAEFPERDCSRILKQMDAVARTVGVKLKREAAEDAT
jgi:hypothetical protein